MAVIADKKLFIYRRAVKLMALASPFVVTLLILLFHLKPISAMGYVQYYWLEVCTSIKQLVPAVGAVSISPSWTASVCRGAQSELTCTTTGSLLEWSFFLVPEGEATARSFARVLHSQSVPSTSDLEVNSITFTFIRSLLKVTCQ